MRFTSLLILQFHAAANEVVQARLDVVASDDIVRNAVSYHLKDFIIIDEGLIGIRSVTSALALMFLKPPVKSSALKKQLDVAIPAPERRIRAHQFAKSSAVDM